jgi:hypothetical protein
MNPPWISQAIYDYCVTVIGRDHISYSVFEPELPVSRLARSRLNALMIPRRHVHGGIISQFDKYTETRFTPLDSQSALMTVRIIHGYPVLAPLSLAERV